MYSIFFKNAQKNFKSLINLFIFPSGVLYNFQLKNWFVCTLTQQSFVCFFKRNVYGVAVNYEDSIN
jgi:hypothetical protein